MSLRIQTEVTGQFCKGFQGSGAGLEFGILDHQSPGGLGAYQCQVQSASHGPYQTLVGVAPDPGVPEADGQERAHLTAQDQGVVGSGRVRLTQIDAFLRGLSAFPEDRLVGLKDLLDHGRYRHTRSEHASKFRADIVAPESGLPQLVFLFVVPDAGLRKAALEHGDGLADQGGQVGFTADRLGESHESLLSAGVFNDLAAAVLQTLPEQIELPGAVERDGALGSQGPQEIPLLSGEGVRLLEIEHQAAEWLAVEKHRQDSCGDRRERAGPGFELRVGRVEFSGALEVPGLASPQDVGCWHLIVEWPVLPDAQRAGVGAEVPGHPQGLALFVDQQHGTRNGPQGTEGRLEDGSEHFGLRLRGAQSLCGVDQLLREWGESLEGPVRHGRHASSYNAVPTEPHEGLGGNSGLSGGPTRGTSPEFQTSTNLA
jgi:hypothetical protein